MGFVAVEGLARSRLYSLSAGVIQSPTSIRNLPDRPVPVFNLDSPVRTKICTESRAK